MITWEEPIVDRSQNDLNRLIELKTKGWFNMTALEKAEWLQDSKGALNRSDLERIENNLQLLSDALELDLTTNVDNVPEILTVSYFDTLYNNLKSLRNVGIRHYFTPMVPDLPFNTFNKINDIEKLLYDVYEILSSNFCYICYEGGEIYTGESMGLVL